MLPACIGTKNRRHGPAHASLAYMNGTLMRWGGETYDFRYRQKSGEILHSEFLRPDWCHEDWDLDQMADGCETSESKKNARVCRRAYFALPHELPDDVNLRIARKIAILIGGIQLVGVALAIHKPLTNPKNVHFHLVWPTRQILPGEVFGSKTLLEVRDGDSGKTFGVPRPRGQFELIRDAFAGLCNLELKLHGLKDDVCLQSYVKQDVAKNPQSKLGPARTRRVRKGLYDPIDEHNRRLREEQRQAETEAELREQAEDLEMLARLQDKRGGDEPAMRM